MGPAAGVAAGRRRGSRGINAPLQRRTIEAGAAGRVARRGAVEFAAVTKRFGAATAVDALDLCIPAGSYCCLLGPSGCGKTTTPRMLDCMARKWNEFIAA